MARDAEAEKARDLARIERALDKIEQVMGVNAPEEAHPTFEEALGLAQLKAIDRIVPLLTRKAAMLGYDQPPGKAGSDATDTIAAVTRRLEAVK